jgi:hypothetical protein
MKQFIKNTILTFSVVTVIFSCTKYDSNIDGAANTANAAASNSTLNNRVTSGFIVNSSTIPSLPAGILPSLTTFRRFLSYDTTKRTGFFADTLPVYRAGDVITIVGYLKGDEFAISKRRINISLFKAPSSFITPANPPSVINVLTRAEDSYRSYQPGVQTGVTSATATPPSAPIFNPTADTILSLPNISPTNVAPFNVYKVMNESIGGINYDTYLVQLTFTIPASYNGKFVSGNVMSINLNAGAPFAFVNTAENASNINWIYAFRIR